MTALPLRDFTAAERERVARAIYDEWVGGDWVPALNIRASAARFADAALAVLSGPSSDAVTSRHEATRQLIARAEGAAGALNAASHEVDDDDDAQLLARRAMQWEHEVERYRAALSGTPADAVAGD